MKIIFSILIVLALPKIAICDNPKSDPTIVRKHLEKIVKTKSYRNFENIFALNKVAKYIHSEFSKYADTTYYQKFTVGEEEYKNVISVFGRNNSKTIVIGAHYDVCGNQDGADDNASGVVGLLELARLLEKRELKYRIEIVAYTLEEPPFFRTEYMGSYQHAKHLYDNSIDVYGMVCLEMIGYFDETKKSQDYPIGFLSLFYGNKGNYVALVNRIKKGKFARRFTKIFKKRRNIPSKKISGPTVLQGIDFSDHLNYWKFGYSSLMITDTAFYRNKNYHKSTDTIDTLNPEKMAKVIDNTLESIISLK